VFAGYIGLLDITERKRRRKRLRPRWALDGSAGARATRIARELHDDINQRLALLAIELQRITLDPQTDIHARSRTVQPDGRHFGRRQALSHAVFAEARVPGVVAAIKGFCAEFAKQQANVTIAFESAAVPASCHMTCRSASSRAAGSTAQRGETQRRPAC
jgi:signal transduction histidine kinase